MGLPDSYTLNSVPFVANKTLVASAARTASGNSGDLNNWSWARYFVFTLDVTAAATDATDTLNVYIQRKLPNGDYDDVVSFTQVLGNGGAVTFVADVYGDPASSDERAPADASLTAGSAKKVWPGETLRVKWVIVDSGDANQSFTFTVTVNARG